MIPFIKTKKIVEANVFKSVIEGIILVARKKDLFSKWNVAYCLDCTNLLYDGR